MMMPGKSALPQRKSSELEVIDAAKRRDEGAIRTIIQANNRMLFRLARSILPSDQEAEDAVQSAYVSAFTRLDSFRGESPLATWLGRIVLNEAMGRTRRARATVTLDVLEAMSDAEIIPFPLAPRLSNPERSMAQQQLRQIVEQAIDGLAPAFRTVLVARLVEELSVEQTAELLGLRPATVKTRLHRARSQLRSALEARLGAVLQDAFPFGGERCQSITDRVIAELQKNP